MSLPLCGGPAREEARPHNDAKPIADPVRRLGPASGVLIATGPIRSGKTTRLAAWAAGRRGVGGVLSPDSPDGRRFRDLSTGEEIALERPAPGEATLNVGRFAFRAAAFAWADERLRTAARNAGVEVIVIDEIGPLELRGSGFATILNELLHAQAAPRLVLVVRRGLLDLVQAAFGLAGARVVDLTADPVADLDAN